MDVSFIKRLALKCVSFFISTFYNKVGVSPKNLASPQILLIERFMNHFKSRKRFCQSDWDKNLFSITCLAPKLDNIFTLALTKMPAAWMTSCLVGALSNETERNKKLKTVWCLLPHFKQLCELKCLKNLSFTIDMYIGWFTDWLK